MITWRIYYGDDATIDSSMGSLYDIEKRVNVQHIACRDTRDGPANIGRYIVSGKYAYWYEDGEWWGGDEFGMWDYLTQRPGPKVVLFGRSISNAKWLALYQRVLNDSDFPPKSAHVAGEYNHTQLRAQDEVSSY